MHLSVCVRVCACACVCVCVLCVCVCVYGRANYKLTKLALACCYTDLPGEPAREIQGTILVKFAEREPEHICFP